MTENNRSLEYFNQVADRWDDLRESYFSEEIREAAIKKAYLRPEMIAADMGGGTGFMTAGLAPLVKQAHLIDQSAEMISVAKENLKDHGNIEYHQSDGTVIPLEDGSVDVVFANMYLHHCTDPAASIAEMVRIIKPGGRLVISDMETHPYEWLKEEMADVWLGFDQDQIRKWFDQADLVNFITDCTGNSCCAESQNQDDTHEGKEAAKIDVFIATGSKRISMREDVESAYGRAAQSKSCCGGSSEAIPCCSSGEYTPEQSVIYDTDYSQDEKNSVPQEASEISLGCGNPIAIANLKSGETVLDIGSGGGMDSFLAAKRVGTNGKVIGVDMTPSMLERARATATKAGITNVEFRYGLAEDLPVDSESLDVILSNCVINLCEDKGKVFQEAFRTLRPGGRIEISDMVTNGPLSARLREDSTEWAGCVSGSLPEQEYLDLVSQAGFENIRALRSTSAGDVDGVAVYSISLSAIKPGGAANLDLSSKRANVCGCGSGGCCN